MRIINGCRGWDATGWDRMGGETSVAPPRPRCRTRGWDDADWRWTCAGLTGLVRYEYVGTGMVDSYEGTVPSFLLCEEQARIGAAVSTVLFRIPRTCCRGVGCLSGVLDSFEMEWMVMMTWACFRRPDRYVLVRGLRPVHSHNHPLGDAHYLIHISSQGFPLSPSGAKCWSPVW